MHPVFLTVDDVLGKYRELPYFLEPGLDGPGRWWQGCFFSCVLDEAHLCRAVRYIERNPVRAGIVNRATDYACSSARPHCGMRSDSILSDISTLMNIGGWAAWLDDEQDPGEVDTLRHHTRTGRPLGREAFLDLLESIRSRPVRPRTPARHNKQQHA